MKPIVLGLVVLLASAASVFTQLAPPVAAPTVISLQDPKSITVYVTRTGEKYHRDGCRHLARSKIPMSLAEAAKRYGPCSVCRPPTVGR